MYPSPSRDRVRVVRHARRLSPRLVVGGTHIFIEPPRVYADWSVSRRLKALRLVAGGLHKQQRRDHMGTRADFYVGVGPEAEWLGSIAWDGYPEGIDPVVLAWAEESGWRESVSKFIESRDDGTKPEMGWPWPWETSSTTDYTYTLIGDRVWTSCFGRDLVPARDYQRRNEEEDRAEDAGEEFKWEGDSLPFSFPNMKARKSVTFGKRSGVIVVG